MKKLRKDNKGFTLVEMIVVLVILAILAAILIPALLGYIDEAKQKQYVLNGKSCYTAAQAVLSEQYAKNNKAPADIDINRILDMADVRDVCQALEIGCAEKYDSSSGAKQHGAYTVNYIHYKEADTDIYYYDNEWTSTSGSPTGSTEKIITYTKP